MKRRDKHTRSAKERCSMLLVADQKLGEVGSILIAAEAPKAFAAYKRLLKSIDMTHRHALGQWVRGEDVRRDHAN